MKKAALITTLLVVGLSNIAIFLTLIHFVLTVSQPHAIVIAMLYIIQRIGEIQLRYLMK